MNRRNFLKKARTGLGVMAFPGILYSQNGSEPNHLEPLAKENHLEP